MKPDQVTEDVRTIGLRGADDVMPLSRVGMSFPHRLSFGRILLRNMRRDGARPARRLWQLDVNGFGKAVYTLRFRGHVYSLVAFSQALPDNQRTDRVIATAWDSAFVLFDGDPSDDDLKRLSLNVPLQEAGRFTESELVLSRANKSVRLFRHVADALESGHQPDPAFVLEVGYLMRTTAVYGNGKFGLADREKIADRPGMSGPFQAEMLAVWLIREFTLDLVEHVACARGGSMAAVLESSTRRFFGVGNSTGLGMAPFIASHPTLLDRWIRARETALMRVRKRGAFDKDDRDSLRRLLRRCLKHLQEWQVLDPEYAARIAGLRENLVVLKSELSHGAPTGRRPWDRLWRRCVALGPETAELCLSLLIEPHGQLIDDLADTLSCPEPADINASMSTRKLKSILARRYGWLANIDFSKKASREKFWYVSEEKLEPRLGHRYREPGSELELPVNIAWQVKKLSGRLERYQPDSSIARFLAIYPHHRYAVMRVQIAENHCYSEIRGNWIGSECRPIDLLRCKLAFMGASKFDPRSDLWLRITLFQGAPTACQLLQDDADDWLFPVQECK